MAEDRSGPWGFGRAPGQTDEDWLATLIETFAVRIDTILASAPIPTLLLRYEDFAVDLRAAAESLASVLGLHLHPDAALAQRPDHHVTSASVEESIGRWRRDLRADVAEAIWTALGSRMATLGYTPE